MQVRLLQLQDAAEWDEFVLGHPNGSPFHLLAWKRSIEEVFPYTAHYLIASTGGRIRGVLPLFLVKNFLMGRVLLSTPFAVYGGVLAGAEEARDALKTAAAELARAERVEYMELRNGYQEQCLGLPKIPHSVTFTQQVFAQDDNELLYSLPKKTRNLVRKARKFAYSMRRATDLDGFYELLSRTYRRLGTPVFPRRHFEALQRNFGDRVDVREVLLDGRVVAVSMNFFFQNQMHTYYAASAPDARAKAVNYYMYFEHLRWAGDNGYRIFDFGKSRKNSGTYDFKRHWRTERRELPYEVLLVNRKEMPNFNPGNPRFQPVIQLWRRMPLPLTRLLGPRLIGLFP